MYVAVAGPTGESRPWVVREADRVRMSVIVPFQPRAFHVVDRTGGFVTAYSSEYLLRRSSDGRDTVALFGRDWSPTAVSAEEKSRIAEQRVEEMFTSNEGEITKSTLRASFDPSYIPGTRPAFEGSGSSRRTDMGAPRSERYNQGWNSTS
jgi:hypothetical protein